MFKNEYVRRIELYFANFNFEMKQVADFAVPRESLSVVGFFFNSVGTAIKLNFAFSTSTAAHLVMDICLPHILSIALVALVFKFYFVCNVCKS